MVCLQEDRIQFQLQSVLEVGGGMEELNLLEVLRFIIIILENRGHKVIL